MTSNTRMSASHHARFYGPTAYCLGWHPFFLLELSDRKLAALAHPKDHGQFLKVSADDLTSPKLHRFAWLDTFRIQSRHMPTKAWQYCPA
jgi:hypothetical protein